MLSGSTPCRDERRGGGVRQSQFPVGRSRQRYAPVVDAGCGRGLRRRRPRLLGLPSFFGTGGSCRKGGGETAVTSGSGDGSRYCSCSSASTDSFSSSSNGTVTHSTGYSSSSSDYYWYYAYGGGGGAAAGTKQQQPAVHKAEATAACEKELMGKKPKKKKNKERRDDKTETTAGGGEAAEDAGVGVAVEKESSDPRADFRDSMAQMVVAEAGLRDWDGLRGMLRRLLALNAPRHHSAILAAFADVCAHIVALPAAAAAPSASPQQQASPPSYFQYRRR